MSEDADVYVDILKTIHRLLTKTFGAILGTFLMFVILCVGAYALIILFFASIGWLMQLCAWLAFH